MSHSSGLIIVIVGFTAVISLVLGLVSGYIAHKYTDYPVIPTIISVSVLFAAVTIITNFKTVLWMLDLTLGNV